MAGSTPKVEPDPLAASLSNMQISPSTPAAALQPRASKKKTAVADSWEEEAEDEDDADSEALSTIASAGSTAASGVDPPPPTPVSPGPQARTFTNISDIAPPRSPGLQSPVPEGEENRRPATTDSVARRMILAGIGVRARSSKEQRDYDAAVREKEKKRLAEERQKAKEAELEKEKAKLSVWED